MPKMTALYAAAHLHSFTDMDSFNLAFKSSCFPSFILTQSTKCSEYIAQSLGHIICWPLCIHPPCCFGVWLISCQESQYLCFLSSLQTLVVKDWYDLLKPMSEQAISVLFMLTSKLFSSFEILWFNSSSIEWFSNWCHSCCLSMIFHSIVTCKQSETLGQVSNSIGENLIWHWNSCSCSRSWWQDDRFSGYITIFGWIGDPGKLKLDHCTIKICGQLCCSLRSYHAVWSFS